MQINRKAKGGQIAWDLRVYNTNSQKGITGKKVFNKKKFQIEKKNMACDYCKKIGHAKESCFKMYGTLD